MSPSSNDISAAILWKGEETLESDPFRLEETNFEIDPRYSPLNPDDDKVSVHHLYIHTSNPDPHVPEDSFKNLNFDCSMLFVGHSSYGGGNSVSKVPNIPITLAKYLAAWTTSTPNFRQALFEEISDSANRILSSTSANQPQIMLRIRFHLIALQAENETDVSHIVHRSQLKGTIVSYIYPGIHQTECKFPLFDHNMLNQSRVNLIEQGDDDNNDCPASCCKIFSEDLICDATAAPTTCKLPCSHVFHYDCILQRMWWIGQNSCPTCLAHYNTVGADPDHYINLIPHMPWLKNKN